MGRILLNLPRGGNAAILDLACLITFWPMPPYRPSKSIVIESDWAGILLLVIASVHGREDGINQLLVRKWEWMVRLSVKRI